MRRLLFALFVLALAPATADAAKLQAGAGRSDVTPPTGYYTMGYVRSDSIGNGVHTRLLARAIVLQRGERKVALVTTDLAFTPGGLLADVADRVADRGFTERNVIVSASHTHGGPAGYSNFNADNFVAPTMGTPAAFDVRADPQLYGFLVERIALAIERADEDLGPARAGWGRSVLYDVTENRSVEAHLANHGMDLEHGHGHKDMDPAGPRHTIDETVDVLRVDRVRRGRRIPLGAWMNYADHGTVNPYDFDVYNGDHHGPAARFFERRVRRLGRVPRRLEVVGAYGNANAGDLSAALMERGPAHAQVVGEREARAMLVAWKRAGRKMTRRPALDSRWTRLCFCGREIDGNAVADEPVMGLPFLTGSDENRGPLYDVDGIEHEGDRLPASTGPQGRKIQAIGRPIGDFPTHIPLAVWRIGGGAIATVPGEMTAEMGRRTRQSLENAVRPAGIGQVALAGYANEYVHYFTTPDEYAMQHYEGGSTLFGTWSGELVRSDLANLARALVEGEPGPEPLDFDPRNGLAPDDTPYGDGTDAATVVAEPSSTRRMQRAAFRWKGAERGLDRPLDRAFIRIERRKGRRWKRVADDLGLQLVWRVDDEGVYAAHWQIPRRARRGTHRFVITANRYRLVSRPFKVRPSRALEIRDLGRGHFALAYPPIDEKADLLRRPELASGGRVRGVTRTGRRVTDRRRRGTTFHLPPGTRIPAGAARDRWGNRTGERFEALSAG